MKIIRKLVVRAAARQHFKVQMDKRHDWITVCKLQIEDMKANGFTDEAISEHLQAVDNVGACFQEARSAAWILGKCVLKKPTLFDLIILRLFPQYIPARFK